MRSDDISRVLNEIDQRFPTSEWTVAGIHALPLFRYEVHNRNHSVYQRSGRAAPSRARVISGRLRVELEGYERWARASWSDRAMNDRIHPADALLYSDGVSFVDLDSKKYERFCDPLRSRLERRGVTTLMITPLHEYLVPRYSPSAFIQPAIEVARTRAIAKTRLGLPKTHLSGLEEIAKLYPDFAFPEATFLARVTVHVEAFARMFERMLRKVRPKAIYVVCYYGAERFAMQLAARRLGIATIDLQHGYAGPLHWAYGRWPAPPKGGFELLPNYYWCWSEDDRQTINAWSDGKDHIPLVGGNLFAQTWHEGADAIVERYDGEVRRVLDRHPGRAAVVYASNGLEGEEQLRALGRVVHETEKDFIWYLRAHPCRMAEGERLERLVREGGATSFDRENATSLPLYSLFRNVDLHVTETSTTTMEAASFGVPSVLWGSLEAKMFAAYTKTGMAVTATPEEFPAKLRAQLAARESLRAAHPDETPPDLDALVALASR